MIETGLFLLPVLLLALLISLLLPLLTKLLRPAPSVVLL